MLIATDPVPVGKDFIQWDASNSALSVQLGLFARILRVLLLLVPPDFIAMRELLNVSVVQLDFLV